MFSSIFKYCANVCNIFLWSHYVYVSVYWVFEDAVTLHKMHPLCEDLNSIIQAICVGYFRISCAWSHRV